MDCTLAYDAIGTNGEGVEMGTENLDFSKILKVVESKQTFIVETWQGHKNEGFGFYRRFTLFK